MEKNSVSKATLGRLPHYLRFLRELPKGTDYVSSTTVARELGLGEVQVRKDLNAVSGKGKPKIGYKVFELIESLETFLGYSSMNSAVLVGAGRLGKALLEYDEFEHYGVKIAAAFDCNKQPVKFNNHEILPIDELEQFCKNRCVQIGIITVGEGSAQEVCDRMVGSGITAIWNFAPCKLSVPQGVLVRHENLALSLAHLNNTLKNQIG